MKKTPIQKIYGVFSRLHHFSSGKANKIAYAFFIIVVVMGLVTIALFAAPKENTSSARQTAGFHQKHTITYDHYSLKIDGKRAFIYSGEVHPFRLPSPSLWLDILEKMKAAGFNTVTVYFDWDYHSSAPGDYNFKGVRNINKFLNMATNVGLYVIVRPGPYINAETDGGGFPGWLERMSGKDRSADPRYMKWAKQWLDAVDPIIAKHQLTNGTGTVIGYQVENEYYNGSAQGKKYMQELEHIIRADGITVPLMGNHNGTFAKGTGAVNIPGFDNYPQGFNCSNPKHWNGIPTWFQRAHARLPQDKPLYLPEFQGGAFDPWGGPGYDKCRALTGPHFENVFYKSLIAQGATMMNFYMTYGGTNWGWLLEPGVYTSYDYGAAINEARQLTPKYYEQKRIAYMADSVRPLRMTQVVDGDPAPTNPAIREDVRANPKTGTHFYILRHKDGTSATDDKMHISIHTADGKYSNVPQKSGTAIELNGRDSKLLIADYNFKAAHLVYSTSELMTEANAGNIDRVLLYGRKGQDGETVLRYGKKPEVKILSGKVSVKWNASHGDLRLDYEHKGLIHVRIHEGGKTLVLLIADYPTSAQFWRDHTSKGPILVKVPYLVRSAKINGATLALRGDTKAPTKLEVFAPSSVKHVTWNGKPVSVSRSRFDMFIGQLGGPPKIHLPKLTNWKFRFGSPERNIDFDDSHWKLADHKTTNNPHKPGSLPILYEDDYGFHHGDVWYRGHFKATGNETGMKIDGEGGDPGIYSVWLNGTLLGTKSSGMHTFQFPKRLLRPGKQNVIAVLVMNMGHDEDYGAKGTNKNPRGIRTAIMQGNDTQVSWRIQGDKGGEYPVDKVRGPMNNGGLYGERHGWYLPGFPDRKWKNVSLPDHWSERGLPAGIGWYRTTFHLNLPTGTDVPIGLKITDNPSKHYRALIFLNGWMMGIYANSLGPQHVFSLPTGILNPAGHNTLAIAVWGENGTSGGIGNVSLVKYGTYSGGVPVQMVRSPKWNAHTWGPPTIRK